MHHDNPSPIRIPLNSHTSHAVKSPAPSRSRLVMNAQGPNEIRITCSMHRGFMRHFLPITLVAISLLGGCVSQKQTWQDWQVWLAERAGEAGGTGGDLAGQTQPVFAAPALKGVPLADQPLTMAPEYALGDAARAGKRFNLAMRNPDFPRTHIEAIYIDLTGPDHWVHLKWSGPLAEQGPIGPWQSTPGRGKPEFDCNDVADSNMIDSFCTPKGVFPVVGFADHLNLSLKCTYATWIIHDPRYIAMHAHHDRPRRPASSGCVRLPFEAAKLIHNNSIAGITLVSIDGQWERPGVDPGVDH